MIDYKIIGNRIKKARIKKGITQENLGISLDYCSKIECGKTKINLERLSQISVIIDIETEYLISGTVYESKSYLKGDIATSISGLNGGKLKAVDSIIKIIKDL